MANIIQRVLKGSPLTLQEHDDNFINLNAELATKATPASVDAQVTSAISLESTARTVAFAVETANRNSAIIAGDTSTLNSAKSYSDSTIATEVTNRNSAITSAVTVLKGGVSADGDTLGKLRNLITGSNSGSNTGDETEATIKSKLGITTLSGSNTGDQTNIAGNAGTATKFQTVRTINGVTFDGTASININAQDSVERVASSLLGAANGVATLGSDGKVPAIQLPSYVDDVVEASSLSSFPVTGEIGKIYVAIDTNKAYRWSGSVYVYITSGAVDSVAGKTGVVSLVKADVGLGLVDNTTDANKPVSTAQATADSNVQAAAASDAMTKANAAQAAAVAASAPVAHVGSGATAHAAVTTTVAGFMSAADKLKLDGIAAGATASTGNVSGVTGTAPIVSSGGVTPVISIIAASNVAPGSMSTADKIKLDAITGTNTGDESQASIQSKLGIVTLSGVNTGDETTATVKAKLGITTLTGVNTGDQTNITGNAGTATTASSLSGYHQASAVLDTATKGLSGINYFNGGSGNPYTDGALYQQAWSPAPTTWGSQIQQDYRTGKLAVRGLNNGTWTPWLTIIDNENIGSGARVFSDITLNAGFKVGGGSQDLSGWGVGNGTYPPNVGGIAPMTINHHTGLVLCAHDAYGGTRIFSQGYPSITGSTLIATFKSTGVVATGNITAYSDERLKKDWAQLPQDFLLKLSEIKCGSYTRVDIDSRQVGVSAQELKAIIPEAVMGTGEGEDYLSVAYGNAALVAAVELSKEVIQLKAIIVDQESRLQKLEALLNK